MLPKVQVMKDQKGEKEEKRKKNAQKEDMRAAFLCCKDKCVCEGKRKCAATGLKICEVCSNILHFTACTIHGKRPIMILPVCSWSASAGSG